MRYDVIVVGGGVSGFTASYYAKKYYPEKSVLTIKKDSGALIGFALSYVFGQPKWIQEEDKINQILSDIGIDVVNDEVVGLDIKNKIVKTSNGKEYFYDKLIIATGSIPLVPQWLKGTELQNVFTVGKNTYEKEKLMEKVKEAKNIVIVGGGFIGVIMADQIAKIGNKNITIVEKLPHILAVAFDEEFCMEVENMLNKQGVNIITGKGIKQIEGDNNVQKVILEDGYELKADLVILALGYIPNTSLVKDTGIELGFRGAIKVDNYMRTSVPDVFAVGDCAEKQCFFLGKPVPIMLASPAISEAKTAVANLYQLQYSKPYNGTIASFFLALSEMGLGSVGLTEIQAKNAGFNVSIGIFEKTGTPRQKLKIIVEKNSGRVIGAQILGKMNVAELVNLLAFIIQTKLTLKELKLHPMLAISPISYSISKAIEDIN